MTAPETCDTCLYRGEECRTTIRDEGRDEICLLYVPAKEGA